MTAPNPHLFSRIIVAYDRPGATRFGHQPGEQTIIEVGADERAQIRFQNDHLDVWILGKDHPTRDEPHRVEVHLAFASMTSFSESDVTFEGIESVDMRATGRPARVIFTNEHTGWV